jgi:hypothetical protein
MGLRIFGAAVAILLAGFAGYRYRKGHLRRGELLLIALVCGALSVAAAAPDLFDPILGALGFEPGQERRIISSSRTFSRSHSYSGTSRATTNCTERSESSSTTWRFAA